MTKYEKLKINLNKALANFTLAKFFGAIFTVTIVAIVKYLISGDFHLEYCDFWNNVGIGLLGWTINTGVIAWLTEYLGIKGINFNLNQFLFGFNTMKVGGATQVGETSSNLGDGKPKLYNAMDSGEGSNSGKKSSGKGFKDRNRDVRVHPYPRNGRRVVRSWVFDDESENGSDNGSDNGNDNRSGSDTEMEGGPSNRNKAKKLASLTSHDAMEGLPLDKGIATDSTMQELPLDKGKGIESANAPQGPPLPIWTRVFPGLDPAFVLLPPRTNPGPGFNVPGSEVPIRDEICQHIDYNTHILSQFKKMDLETAIQQRDRYWLSAQFMNSKIAYAQETLSKVPTIPTNEYEFRLKNQILRDLEAFNRVKVRSEARATLLDSRISFINTQIGNKNDNN